MRPFIHTRTYITTNCQNDSANYSVMSRSCLSSCLSLCLSLRFVTTRKPGNEARMRPFTHTRTYITTNCQNDSANHSVMSRSCLSSCLSWCLSLRFVTTRKPGNEARMRPLTHTRTCITTNCHCCLVCSRWCSSGTPVDRVCLWLEESGCLREMSQSTLVHW